MCLIDSAVADLEYFVSALLIDTGFGPVRIKYEYKGWFIIEIYPRLIASRVIGDIGVDSIGESIISEILYLRVLYFDLWVWIRNDKSRVIGVGDVQLPKTIAEYPSIVVGVGSEFIDKPNDYVWDGEDETMIFFEWGYTELLWGLVDGVRDLVGTYETDYADIVDG